MKRTGIIFVGTLLNMVVFCSTALACQITYTLTDSRGNTQQIISGKTIQIIKGETYTLKIDFYEDHRNCKIPPEQTVFLLNDKTWEYGRTNLPLELLGPIRWQIASSRFKVGMLQFRVVQTGLFTLEILRDCTKEGYEGVFQIRAS